MLISKEVVVKWNSANKRYYETLGYAYTKIGDEFIVKVEDLTIGSHSKVLVKCDYCKKEFLREYRRYLELQNSSETKKDCCVNCIGYKSNETFFNEHGYYVGKDSIQQTLKVVQEKYGVNNIVYIEGVAKKISESNRLNIGELSSGWQGGKTRENLLLRSRTEYQEWRNLVFERDNYTCQCCGKTHTELNAHHIFSFIDNKELRLIIDNGITLCKTCHMTFHSIYGRGKNTKNQFEDFITNIEKGQTTIESAS